jgi:hypothetical protein
MLFKSSAPDFTKYRQMVSEINLAGGQAWPPVYAFTLCFVREEVVYIIK